MNAARRIFIGGSKHGQVFSAFREPFVRVAIPSLSPTFELEVMPCVEDTFTLETYQLRTYELAGTRRSAQYLVLQSLSDSEAARLIEEYEAHNSRSESTVKANTFLSVARLLWDWRGWTKVGILDAVTYRDTGLHFFLSSSCVNLWSEKSPHPVYSPSLVTWIFFILLCLRLQVCAKL
jgi:hypothetical protein